jgi:hypothetical protein
MENPKTIKGGEPFIFGGKLYTMQYGSDDELNIMEIEE